MGVLGAGFMGHGIAYVSAVAGIDVVMKDVTCELAEAGKTRITALLDDRVSRGKLSDTDKERILARIQTTDDAKALADCDLIIEAVFEDRDVKAQVTQEAEGTLTSKPSLARTLPPYPLRHSPSVDTSCQFRRNSFLFTRL